MVEIHLKNDTMFGQPNNSEQKSFSWIYSFLGVEPGTVVYEIIHHKAEELLSKKLDYMCTQNFLSTHDIIDMPRLLRCMFLCMDHQCLCLSFNSSLKQCMLYK